MPAKVNRKATGAHYSVWLELPQPMDDQHAEHLCALANAMIEKLARPEHLINGHFPRRFFWNRARKMYCYGGDQGYDILQSRGIWFSLNYLAGRD
jgi:hypothetical protein